MAMVDLRLWQRVTPVRRYLSLTALVSAAVSALIIVQAVLIAGLVSDLVTDGRVEPTKWRRDLAFLIAIAVARAALAWYQDRLALPAARRIIADLRQQVVAKVVALGPRWSGGAVAETAISATQGLDALEPYLVKYLPSLLLTALVTPAALIVVGGLDWIALAICLVALPLVPLFMWLIGTMTAATSHRRLAVVNRLGAQVLDLLTGLPTLKAFGREIGPGARVRALGEASRAATMSTLRVAFLSSMVLELLTTLAVAMVAVSVGLRLVVGGMTLRAGLAVIMLAPEVFAPLRQVAAQFHASTDGLAATDAVFAILETPIPSAPRDPASPLRSAQDEKKPTAPEEHRSVSQPSVLVGRLSSEQGTPQARRERPSKPPTKPVAICLTNVSVLAGDRNTIAPANLTARIQLEPDADHRGHITALVGPSGSGKSTTSLLILGLLSPDAGTVTLETPDQNCISLPDFGLENWWRQLLWIPQRPALEGRNRTLSIGQRQQVALANIGAAESEKRLLILDEPTAHLDAATEATILHTLQRWRDSGRSAIVIAHRPSVIALADQIVEVGSANLNAANPSGGPEPSGTTQPLPTSTYLPADPQPASVAQTNAADPGRSKNSGLVSAAPKAAGSHQ